jgi:hypothetical protein
MFTPIVRRSLQGATLTSLILAGIGSCTSDDSNNPTPTGTYTTTTTSTGGTAGTGGSTTNTGGNGGSSTTTAGGSSGSGGTGGSTGGKGGSGGTGGSAGTAGSAGNGGSAGTAGSGGAKDGGMAGSGMKDSGTDAPAPTEGGAMCTPMGTPNATTGYTRTGWGGQWTPACNFKSGNGTCTDLPPKNAFDGKSNRTSLGDTHLMAGGNTAEMIGDTFTFDMQACHSISKIDFYCGDPPNNSGFDARDFPGQVEVSISSDCTTSAQGDITGTFTPFTPALFGNEPTTANGQGCSRSSCNGPFEIMFPQGTAAKCVRMRLTKVLAAGGGVWWAIDELYVF